MTTRKLGQRQERSKSKIGQLKYWVAPHFFRAVSKRLKNLSMVDSRGKAEIRTVDGPRIGSQTDANV